MGRRYVRRIAAAISLTAVALLMSGCEYFSSPQNTFAPEGEAARYQRWDFLVVMWPALAVMILVMAALIVIPVMFRRKKNDPGLPKQVHGNTTLELTWTILPAILLAVIAVPTLAGIQRHAERPGPEALTVQVTGQQFLWQFDYPEIRDSDGVPASSLSEMYIPAGERVELLITSIDVNHSFWIPKLAGKIDAIQNHPNYMWIQADKPGVYEGQCAEFCGLSHAEMRMRVHALSPEDWDAWIAEQGATFTPGDEGDDAGSEGGDTDQGGAGEGEDSGAEDGAGGTGDAEGGDGEESDNDATAAPEGDATTEAGADPTPGGGE